MQTSFTQTQCQRREISVTGNNCDCCRQGIAVQHIHSIHHQRHVCRTLALVNKGAHSVPSKHILQTSKFFVPPIGAPNGYKLTQFSEVLKYEIHRCRWHVIAVYQQRHF